MKYSWCIFGLLAPLVTVITADPFNEIAEKYGYPVEVHKNIQTPDGYLLTMQRIPHGKFNNVQKKRPPVLLMHGMFGSAEHFIFLGPGRSLGFLLAEEGYDVWFGNMRSVSYSRHHVKYDPDRDRAFWNFTAHELAVYDTPTKIDYILEKTGFETLFYVGHSQGCVVFFAMCALLPEYNKKITLFSGLSAVLFLSNLTHPWLLEIVKHEKELNKFCDVIQLDEINLANSLVKKTVRSVCSTPFIAEICKILLMILAGSNYQQLDSKFLPDMLLNTPEGVGRIQFFHACQMSNSGNFQRYDYGVEKNLEIYGQNNPPFYDLAKISAPIALYYSRHDWFLPLQHHERTMRVLKNVVEEYEVPDKEFTHLDFIGAKDVYPLLNKRVIDVMNSYRNVI